MPKKLNEYDVKDRLSKYGFILVSEFKNTSTKIAVKCRCGNQFISDYWKLTSGHTKSCGCLVYPKLIGKKFGKLTVIAEVPKKKRSYGGHWWLCKCECGNEKETITNSLTSGATRSCGCLHFGENNHQWTGYKNISGKFWINLITSARRRNIQFDLTKESAWEIFKNQNFKCALSGVDLCIGSYRKETTASIDRIDSSKSYTKDNIQWVHKTVNKMKMEFNMTDFISWCEKISNYTKIRVINEC